MAVVQVAVRAVRLRDEKGSLGSAARQIVYFSRGWSTIARGTIVHLEMSPLGGKMMWERSPRPRPRRR